MLTAIYQGALQALFILTGRMKMKRVSIVQDRQPQGCGCRAYMDVFTACFEQWTPFSSVPVIRPVFDVFVPVEKTSRWSYTAVLI
jgi:hypothetical protein